MDPLIRDDEQHYDEELSAGEDRGTPEVERARGEVPDLHLDRADRRSPERHDHPERREAEHGHDDRGAGDGRPDGGERRGGDRPPLRPAESRRREAAVNFARSSVGLEGFMPSKAAETGARQFIKGDIQLADFVQVKPDAEQAYSR